MAAVLWGIPVGVLSSIFTWWILWHAIAPRGQYSSEVCVFSPPPRNGGPDEMRVKFVNRSRRPLIDVSFSVFLFVPGGNEDVGSQSLVRVPILVDEFAFIGTANKNSRVSGVLNLSYRTLVLRPDLMVPSALRRLSEPLRSFFESGDLVGFVEFCNVNTRASLQVVCSTSDGLTGARKALVSPRYGGASFTFGKFERGRSLKSTIVDLGGSID